MKSKWKKGRGKLGVLQPLMGSWEASAETPMGKCTITREFKFILNSKYIQLNVKWQFTKGVYEEQAVIGIRDDKLSFWSFTSDGKRSEGYLADGSDLHPDAVCFEANMPAGLARMIYWPDEGGGFNWAVESKTKKGWNRFVAHKYRAV